jgi:hypothetical protein
MRPNPRSVGRQGWTIPWMEDDPVRSVRRRNIRVVRSKFTASICSRFTASIYSEVTVFVPNCSCLLFAGGSRLHTLANCPDSQTHQVVPPPGPDVGRAVGGADAGARRESRRVQRLRPLRHPLADPRPRPSVCGAVPICVVRWARRRLCVLRQMVRRRVRRRRQRPSPGRRGNGGGPSSAIGTLTNRSLGPRKNIHYCKYL